jgi:hypothetical protein
MVNFQNGKIYKIVDVGRTKMYIGSTTKDYVSKRMVEHRNKYKNYKSGGKAGYVSVYDLFDEFGIDNCSIELIENYPCQSRDELRRKEGEIIQASDCVNKRVVCQTKEEGRGEDNKDAILIMRKASFKANWDKINAKRRANYAKKYPIMN